VVLAGTVLLAGCGGGESNTNSNTAPSNSSVPNRNGIVETNVNMPARTNGNNVPSNMAVMTNNNGNKNTAAVQTTNTANTHNRNAAGNKNTSNRP
jgi:hypothetical protein